MYYIYKHEQQDTFCRSPSILASASLARFCSLKFSVTNCQEIIISTEDKASLCARNVRGRSHLTQAPSNTNEHIDINVASTTHVHVGVNTTPDLADTGR